VTDASLAMITKRIPGSPVFHGRQSLLQNEVVKEFGACADIGKSAEI
jgi:hypothetical protein